MGAAPAPGNTTGGRGGGRVERRSAGNSVRPTSAEPTRPICLDGHGYEDNRAASLPVFVMEVDVHVSRCALVHCTLVVAAP